MLLMVGRTARPLKSGHLIHLGHTIFITARELYKLHNYVTMMVVQNIFGFIYLHYYGLDWVVVAVSV